MSNTNKRFILEVPYQEKNQAKDLGAWWDPDIKKWFVPEGRDTIPFKKWFPKEHEKSDALTRN